MTTLRGLTWDHTRGWAPLAATSQVFRDHRPDVRVDWDRESLWAFGEGGLTHAAQVYDLIIVDHPMVGVMAESGLFRPFPARPRAAAVGLSAPSYHLDGHQWALPVDAACQVSVFRPDLLAHAGRGCPDTWDAVLELAATTGKVAMPLTPIDVLSSLITLCGGTGGGSGPAHGAFLPRRAALEALGLLRRLRDLMPGWCVDRNPIAVLETMSSSADVWYCPLLFGYTNYSRRGYARHQVRFGDIPRRGGPGLAAGALLGGAGIAVTAGGQDPRLAAEYAEWVASSDVQRGPYLQAGGQPAAAAAWSDPDADRLTGGFFSATRATIDRAVLRPRHSSYPRFQTDVAVLLHTWLTGPVTTAEGVLDHIDAAYRASTTTGSPTAALASPTVRSIA